MHILFTTCFALSTIKFTYILLTYYYIITLSQYIKDTMLRNEDSTKATIQNQLITTISQACNCDVTTDNLKVKNLSCGSNALTLYLELVYSDPAGTTTASDLLTSAAAKLMGGRLVEGQPLVINTQCALRDSQNNCIEVNKLYVNVTCIRKLIKLIK